MRDKEEDEKEEGREDRDRSKKIVKRIVLARNEEVNHQTVPHRLNRVQVKTHPLEHNTDQCHHLNRIIIIVVLNHNKIYYQYWPDKHKGQYMVVLAQKHQFEKCSSLFCLT